MSKHTVKKRRFAPAICSFLGLLIIFSIIAFFAPMALQNVFGYHLYNVVSESMNPAIPMGSAVFVMDTEPQDVSEGEVIAFGKGENVITHRVVQNRVVEGKFITKGDANEKEDVEPIPYGDLVGIVRYHVPFLGVLMEMFTTTLGKIYGLIYLVCGGLFMLLAGQLRSKNIQK